MKTRILFTLLLACSLLACEKKEYAPTPHTGKVYLNIASMKGADTLHPLDSFTVGGRPVALNLAQFYISQLYLVNCNGTTTRLDSVYIIKTLDKQRFFAGTAPVGTYCGLGFTIGLNSFVNSKPPSSQTPSMYLGPGNGYGFISLSTVSQAAYSELGYEGQVFHYVVNKDQGHAVQWQSAQTTITLDTGVNTINMGCNYPRFFTGLNFAQPADSALKLIRSNAPATLSLQ